MSPSVQREVMIVAKPHDAEVMRAVLATAGYRIVVSDGTDDPVARIENERPAAVILALSLDAADGEAVLWAMRARAHGGGVPVVLYAEPGSGGPLLADALRRGADHLLLGPVDEETLLAKLEAVIDDVDPALEALFEEETGEEITAEHTGERTGEDDLTPPVTDPGEIEPAAGPAVAVEALAGERHEASRTPQPEVLSPLQQELQRELDAIDRQIFPDAEESYRVVEEEDADLDALEDLDLEALAVDGLSGLAFDAAPGLGAAAAPRGGGAASEQLLAAVWEPLAPGGDLAATDLPGLLVALDRRGFCGRLVLRRDETVKMVRLDGGRVVFAASRAGGDRLIDLLLREGRISREEYEAHEEWDTGVARTLAARLVDEGVLVAAEVPELLRRHVTEIVYSLFSWVDGRYELHAEDAPANELLQLGVDTAALVTEGVRRKFGEDRLAQRLGDRTLQPDAAAVGAEALARAGLSVEERQIVALLDGTRTIGEAAQLGGLDALRVSQVVYALHLLGYCSLRPHGDGGEAASLADRDPELARRRVRAKYAQVCEGDYFSLLGLRSDASLHERRQAHQRMRERFDAHRLPPEVARELAEELAEIAEVLDEALRVLSDEARCDAYRRTL